MPPSNDANADTLTGCLKPNGTLVNLAVGDTPSKPCKPNEMQVTLGEKGEKGDTGDTGPEGPPAEQPDTRIVFVTSNRYLGDFSDNGFGCSDGVAGADCICNALADAEGLGTNFKAWLSSSIAGENPASSFFQSDIPYARVDGVKVAANWGDLTDGFILHPIEVDEQGGFSAALSDQQVWTGTSPDGTLQAAGDTCVDWTSIVGTGQHGRFNDLGEGQWTFAGSTACDQTRRLYCFEQGPPE